MLKKVDDVTDYKFTHYIPIDVTFFIILAKKEDFVAMQRRGHTGWEEKPCAEGGAATLDERRSHCAEGGAATLKKGILIADASQTTGQLPRFLLA
ncbi:MAG: hypothetical protein LIP03_03405 [Bacteroidales bacterium]|nr:hypothetical protein [Bacteroidales bacterium]